MCYSVFVWWFLSFLKINHQTKKQKKQKETTTLRQKKLTKTMPQKT